MYTYTKRDRNISMRVRPQKPQAPYTHSPNPLSSEHSLPSRLSVLLDNPLKGLICEPVCTPTPIHKYKGLLQNKNRLAKSTHPDTHRLRVFKSMQVQIVIHGGLIFQQEPQEKCKGGIKEWRERRRERAPRRREKNRWWEWRQSFRSFGRRY